MSNVNQTSLKDQVQEARNNARQVLRMVMINNVMEDLFHIKKELESSQKALDLSNRRLAGAEYDKGNLDVKHPEIQDKIEAADNIIETRKKNVEYYTKQVEIYGKKVKELETEIEDIESGKKLVSIDEVNRLAEESLRKV